MDLIKLECTQILCVNIAISSELELYSMYNL